MNKWTETEMQLALFSWLENAGRTLILPNFTPRKWHECDLFSITTSLYFHEIEVKVSVSDFYADKAKREKHRAMRGDTKTVHHILISIRDAAIVLYRHVRTYAYREAGTVNRRCVDERKATQVAAYFLRSASNHIQQYIKLAKLVYFADRTALLQLGRTITKGQHFSLPDGPVVSEINDLLSQSKNSKRYRSNGYWDDHIICSSEDGVHLVRDPGMDMLSDSERQVLEQVQGEQGKKTTDDVLKYAHALPEYREPEDEHGRIPITYTRILHEEHIERKTASTVVRNNEIKDHIRDMLASVK